MLLLCTKVIKNFQLYKFYHRKSIIWMEKSCHGGKGELLQFASMVQHLAATNLYTTLRLLQDLFLIVLQANVTSDM